MRRLGAPSECGNEMKWVNIEYPAGSVGVKTLAVKVRVRPAAKPQNALATLAGRMK